jgi:hypothetical protein
VVEQNINHRLRGALLLITVSIVVIVITTIEMENKCGQQERLSTPERKRGRKNEPATQALRLVAVGSNGRRTNTNNGTGLSERDGTTAQGTCHTVTELEIVLTDGVLIERITAVVATESNTTDIRGMNREEQLAHGHKTSGHTRSRWSRSGGRSSSR